MWIAKIKLKGEHSLFGSKTKKHEVSLRGYPLSRSVKDKKIVVFLAGEVFGEEQNIEAFIKDLSNEKEILNIEKCDRFFILTVLREPLFDIFYNLNFVYIKPIMINERGENFFEIGSFDRQELINFVNLTEKEYDAELLSIIDSPIHHISIISPYPNITLRQKQAFELAINEGYYEYPKKIDLKKLAKIRGVSFSTFRAHLKKAESKLMGFVFKHL